MRNKQSHLNPCGRQSRLFAAWLPSVSARRAFTLIEMLVVVGIVLTLTVVVVVGVNFALAGDRIPSASRQIQSYLEGARDRAIYAKEPRGVRFLLDEAIDVDGNRSQTVTSMVYISGPIISPTGVLQLTDDPATPNVDPVLIRNYGLNGTDDVTPATGLDEDDPTSFASWDFLSDVSDPTNPPTGPDNALITVGTRIRVANSVYTPGTTVVLDDGNSEWYTIDSLNFNPANESMRLTREHDTSPSVPGLYQYQLELISVVLPGADVVSLPEGIVIDLESSKLPNIWRDAAGNFGTTKKMDVLFSPRGAVTGPVASSGLLHFLVAELPDIDARKLAATPQEVLDSAPGSPNKEGGDAIVTLFTRTGHITTSEVFNEDLDVDGVTGGDADDPDYNENGIQGDPVGSDIFFYAETGEAPLK